MDSDRTIIKLVASVDFLAAKDLSKEYPEIAVDKEILIELKKGLGLIDSEANDLDELENDIKANIFSDDIPKSLQYKYCRQEHGYFTTLILASLNGDEEMLKELNPQKISTRDMMNCCLSLRKNSNNEFNDTGPSSILLPSIFDLGLEKKIDYTKVLQSEALSEILIEKLCKYQKWDEITANFTPADISDFMNGVYGVCCMSLASKRKDILTNPPEALLKIPGFNMKEFHEYNTSEDCAFPWNLANDEQVKFYEKEIRQLHDEIGNDIVGLLYEWNMPIQSLSMIKAIKEIIGKECFNYIFSKKNQVEYVNIDSGNLKEDIEIAEFIGLDKKNFLVLKLQKSSAKYPLDELSKYFLYRKEYLRIGGKESDEELQENNSKFLEIVDSIE